MQQQSIQTLPVDSLQPNPLQPRGAINAEALADLVQSVKEHGILEPLVVAHTPAGYQIIAGERRWRASKIAGLKDVPVIVKETTPQGMLEMAIIENVQRIDLNVLDRAKAFERLATEFQLTTNKIAERVGKSAPYVSNTLRMLKLPEALQDGLLSGLITEGHARALAAIEDTRLMVEAFKILIRENGSVRRAEDLARRMKTQSGQPLSRNPGHRPYMVSKEIDEWAQQLQSSFGKNAKVHLTRSKRETKVVIALKGTPEETQEQLQKVLSLTK